MNSATNPFFFFEEKKNLSYYGLAGMTCVRLLAALCLLGVLCSVHGDLTARLVDDSDHLANIVGAKETESLVDYKLKKVR
jgi:hypothetical protein